MLFVRFDVIANNKQGVVSTVSEQLLVAADIRPKKFRTRLQRALYEGPTARKDAEIAERERWVYLLANLLRSTETPMGKLLRENPCNVQLLGGGRRAGTLRIDGSFCAEVHRLADRISRRQFSRSIGVS